MVELVGTQQTTILMAKVTPAIVSESAAAKSRRRSQIHHRSLTIGQQSILHFVCRIKSQTLPVSPLQNHSATFVRDVRGSSPRHARGTVHEKAWERDADDPRGHRTRGAAATGDDRGRCEVNWRVSAGRMLDQRTS